MTELKDTTVLVVGLGRSGEAAARFLLRQGALVVATDAGTNERLRALQRELEQAGCRVEIGDHTPACLKGVDLVVLSPGVPPIVLPVQLADERGIPIISEIEFAFRFCRSRIAAITGTNGKTTVTHLVEALLRAGGLECVAAGNVGTPLIDHVEAIGPNGVLVIEVSSFQLERIERFRPHAGVWLNVAPDHLDRYASLDEYAAAKGRLFENQRPGDMAIVHDSVLEAGYCPQSSGEQPTLIVYGDSERCDLQYLDHTIVSRSTQRRYPLQGNWHLPGRHNVHNAMAAIAVAEAFDVRADAIVDGLRAFRGLPHRIEFVDEQCGARYINDSKGTNVDAVIKAIETIHAPLLLIAGGVDKALDFTPLQPFVRQWVKRMILIGEAAPKLERTFADSTTCTRAGSLEEAVQVARAHARPGDTVLLSPGCASFDMFRDYADRGDQFKACVRSNPACSPKAGS